MIYFHKFKQATQQIEGGSGIGKEGSKGAAAHYRFWRLPQALLLRMYVGFFQCPSPEIAAPPAQFSQLHVLPAYYIMCCVRSYSYT